MATSIPGMLNKTPIYIEVIRDHESLDDSITFYFGDGQATQFYHSQDCCENVYIEDISGDFNNLLLKPILRADEKSSSYDPEDPSTNLSNVSCIDSATWTFCTFAGPKGYVDVRWCGESNGYYSEDVNFRHFPYSLESIPKSRLDELKTQHIELFI